jgi:periplasmic copper chaperone A
MIRTKFDTLPGLVLALSALSVAPAEAHVRVLPATVDRGAFAKLTLRMPNESASASVTSLEIDLPLDKPLTSVSVRPHPGWTSRIERSRLAQPIRRGTSDITDVVSKIVWTADRALAPGEFDEFEISAGPFPTDADTLSIVAIQTYSDGKAVAWNEPVGKGSTQPDHPAPTLTLTAPRTAEPAEPGDAFRAATESARTLGIAGLVAGLLGCAIAAAALVAQRRKS